MSKNSELEKAQKKTEEALKKVNEKIGELGQKANVLCNTLNEIQEIFDRIRNIPSEKKYEYEKLKKVRLNWKQQAEKIEQDYRHSSGKAAGGAAAGVSAGVAVAAMGPTVAMGIATTFGVASTGTAISTLSGAAATNAALAWLGGGALAAGGGGMAAGNALLAMAGPVGWAIAGVALLSSGIFIWKAKSDKDRLEKIFLLISERDTKKYQLALTELNERISHIKKEEKLLRNAIAKIKTFGYDYLKMNDSQKLELGSYVNLMSSSTNLLVNPIMGLQPKCTEEKFSRYCSSNGKKDKSYCNSNKDIIISLANLLYKIKMDDTDKKLLRKSLTKNKKFLESVKTTKEQFKDERLFDNVFKFITYLG